MKNILPSMWRDLKAGENVDIYTTIVLLIVLAISSIFDLLPANILIPIGLSAIAIILTGLLQIRKKVEDNTEELQNLLHQSETLNTLDSKLEKVLQERTFFQEAPEGYFQYNALIKIAKDMFFWGVTLERISGHLHQLARKDDKPFRVRFLILKKDGMAVKMESFRSSKQRSVDEIHEGLNVTATNLRALAREINPPSKIEVRVIDYLPPWSVSAIDPESENGIMYTSILSFRAKDVERPSFLLKMPDDSVWMRRIKAQFEQLWDTAEPLEPPYRQK